MVTDGGDPGVYEGMWVDGKRCGEGYWYGDDGTTHEGTWRDGHMDRGTTKWQDGSSYTGEWREDEITGRGKVRPSHVCVMTFYMLTLKLLRS